MQAKTVELKHTKPRKQKKDNVNLDKDDQQSVNVTADFDDDADNDIRQDVELDRADQMTKQVSLESSTSQQACADTSSSADLQMEKSEVIVQQTIDSDNMRLFFHRCSLSLLMVSGTIVHRMIYKKNLFGQLSRCSESHLLKTWSKYLI